MENTAMMRGIGAGLVAGAAIGAIVTARRGAMKTRVGRTMQEVGSAMDGALYDLLRKID